MFDPQTEAAEAKRKADELARAAKSAEEAAAARAWQEKVAADNERKRLAVEAENAQRAQEQLQLVNDHATQNAEAVLPQVVAPPKAEGQSVRHALNYEVTDIWALVRSNPGLVEIKPRRREILEFLNMLDSGATPPSVAGLRVWRETKSSTRAAREKEVVEV